MEDMGLALQNHQLEADNELLRQQLAEAQQKLAGETGDNEELTDQFVKTRRERDGLREQLAQARALLEEWLGEVQVDGFPRDAAEPTRAFLAQHKEQPDGEEA